MRRLGSELRQRKHLKVIQDLDAFPKVPESYQKTTASGGTGCYAIMGYYTLQYPRKPGRSSLDIGVTLPKWFVNSIKCKH